MSAAHGLGQINQMAYLQGPVFQIEIQPYREQGHLGVHVNQTARKINSSSKKGKRKEDILLLL